MRLFLILLFLIPASFLLAETSSLKADLNGDAKPDVVEIFQKAEQSFLKINQTEILLKQGSESIEIIDIQKKDKRKEVKVHVGEGLDNDPYEIYSYDGKNIYQIGTIFSPQYSGNGILYSNEWMGFWSKKVKYTLNPDKKTLMQAPQELFSVNVKARIKESFPIYQKQNSKTRIAYLRKGSQIEIFAAYTDGLKEENYLYLIRSSEGLIGWIEAKDIRDKMEDIPWAG
ncbi:MAG: hypothetical protein H7A25_20075 [Leptospiraceae bacterium]|nr:hypothetical protein [Leptospiraceae bacterium]MCP5502207.1 hypothetical protein [Leptospiraceae bacterium]